MVLKEFPKSLLFDILKILHFETGLYSVKCYYPGLLKTINFPDRSVGKESPCNSGDSGSIPGLRRSPGEGNGSLLQYSCREKPMNRGVWGTTALGVAKNWTQLSSYHLFTFRLLWGASQVFRMLRIPVGIFS